MCYSGYRQCAGEYPRVESGRRIGEHFQLWCRYGCMGKPSLPLFTMACSYCDPQTLGELLTSSPQLREIHNSLSPPSAISLDGLNLPKGIHLPAPVIVVCLTVDQQAKQQMLTISSCISLFMELYTNSTVSNGTL